MFSWLLWTPVLVSREQLGHCWLPALCSGRNIETLPSDGSEFGCTTIVATFVVTAAILTLTPPRGWNVAALGLYGNHVDRSDEIRDGTGVAIGAPHHPRRAIATLLIGTRSV